MCLRSSPNDKLSRPVNPTSEKPVKMKLAVLAALAFASSAAFAFHCPADMKKIDAALAKKPKLSAQQMTDVKKSRADGEASHKAGKHADSEASLKKAKGILGLK